MQMFAQNLALIIGGLIFLFLGFVVLMTTWTGINTLVWIMRKRHADRKVFQKTHRADGQLYPPMGAGVCEVCGRGSDHIYFPPSGERLCPSCYEKFWRENASKETPHHPQPSSSVHD